MARSFFTALSVLAASATTARAAIPVDSGLAQRSTDCDDVHMFLARGNNEPYPGRQGAMVESICDDVSSCGYEDLIYSALYTDLSCQTCYDGVVAAYKQVSDYACQCPDAKLILLGYSQGAQIITDFLGGGGGTLWNGCIQPTTPALNRSTFPGNRISAVVVFGDERHTANQSYNFGSGSGIDGDFPRPSSQLELIDDYSSIVYSYCAHADPICAADQSESNYNVSVHLDYYDIYASAAGSWAKSVASITNDATVTTAIPTSISGTAQEYSTIASDYTPSGTVTTTSIQEATCSATTASTAEKTASASSGSTSASASSTSVETKTTAAASSTGSAEATSTAASSTSASATSTAAGSSSTMSPIKVGLAAAAVLQLLM